MFNFSFLQLFGIGFVIFLGLAPPILSSQRILSGRNGTIEEVPYQVSVLFDGNHHCGGSIITDFWIVSVAHCFPQATNRYSIRIGSSLTNFGGIIHAIETIIRHESWGSPITHANDFAVIKVVDPMEFSVRVQPVVLPEESDEASIGAMGTISGYGRITWMWGPPAATVQITELPVISQEECRAAYSANQITEGMLCAGFLSGNIGTCEGDSGGPLVIDGLLHGAIAWNLNCGSLGHPTVFARISYFRNWIRHKTGF